MVEALEDVDGGGEVHEDELLLDRMDIRDQVEGVENEIGVLAGEDSDIDVLVNGDDERSDTKVDVKLASGDRSCGACSFSCAGCWSKLRTGKIASILGAEIDSDLIF